MGIVVLFVAIFPQLGLGGKHLFKTEVTGPISEGLKPRIKQTALRLWWVYLFFTATCTVLLYLVGLPLFDALCHALSTLSTGGFSTKSASVGAFKNPSAEWIVIFFMLAGGINFALYYNLFRGKVTALYKSVEVRYFVLANLFISLFIFLSMTGLTNHNWLDEFREALFQTLAVTTTTGLMTADFDTYPIVGKYLLFLCMFIGGCAGSTAGGLKVSRVLIVIRRSFQEIRLALHPQEVVSTKLGQHKIPAQVINTVFIFAATYILLYTFGVLIMFVLGHDAITSASSVIACLASVGPGFGSVGPTQSYETIHPIGKLVLCFFMIAGRLEIFVLLFLIHSFILEARAMRNILILAILFSLSFVLQALGVQMGAQPGILLAVGFVILAAYTLSEIGSSLTLPRVTGYILAGLLLGPYAFSILTTEIVQEIKVFNTLAIGLIAITAGLELHFSSLKKTIAAILSTTALKMVTLGLLVTGTFFAIEHSFQVFALENSLITFSVGLIFATLCLGTSPAIALAVLSETKAKGRMSQLVLGSAIVKDVVVVVTLAVVMSIAKAIAGGGGSMTEALHHLSIELLYSIAAGALLGALFILYIRFIRQEMFLFISAMIFITAEFSKAVHLELLLVFIVAGVVVRNFSKTDKILHDALVKVSLPVFVVFFTNVGAGLDLQSTWQYLPIAGAIFAARALSFFLSGWLAGRWHDEKPPIGSSIWMGYLPQAGVTLGLIAIATGQLSEYSDVLTNVGMGLVTLNLLIGPVSLRLALRGSKEISDVETEIQPQTKSIEEPEKTLQTPIVKNEDLEFENLMKDLKDRVYDPTLREKFIELSTQFYMTFKKHHLVPQKSILQAFSSDLHNIYEHSEKEIVNRIDEHFSRMGQKGKEIYHSISNYQREIELAPVSMTVPLHSQAIKWNKGDSLFQRLFKLIKRPQYLFTKKPERIVPVRKTIKYSLEPFAGSFTLDLIHAWYRLLGLHIDTFQKNLESNAFAQQDVIEKIQKENELWVSGVIDDFISGFRKVATEWINNLNRINTVYLSDAQLRYSHVEPEIKEFFESSKQASVDWEEKFIFCRNRLKVIVQTALLSRAVEKLLGEKFFTPVNEAKLNADTLVKDVFSYFDKVEEQLQGKDQLSQELFQKLYDETLDFSKNHLQADIKSKYIRGSFRLLNRDISINLKKSLPTEEGSFQITSEQTPPHEVRTPSEIMVKKINLHELFEQSILINFLPTIEDRIEGISNYIESLLMEMEQAFSIMIYSFKTQSTENSEKDLSDKEIIESVLTSLKTEREKISDLYRGLDEYIDRAEDSATKLIEESQQEVKEGIERFSVVSTAKNQFRQSFLKIGERLSQKKEAFKGKIERVYNKLKNSSRYSQDREIDLNLRSKIANKTLDTTTIRQFIDETYKVQIDFKNLPRVYLRLFNLDPIQDKRFYIAHKNQWKHIEPLAQSLSFRESYKILVLGERGIGKSSLLNVAQMDIRTDRLIRIEEVPQKSPLHSLAQILGCSPQFKAVLNNLKRQSTTIIIDNVDQWVNRSRINDFFEFLSIIKESSHQSHWLLSMTKSNFNTYDKAFKIKNIFNKIIDLSHSDLDESREIILSRQRLSGLEAHFPRTFVSEWALKLGLAGSDEMFFRLLFERSKGHIRQLIFLWLLSLDNADNRGVHLSLDGGIDRGLPFINELSLQQKYILNQLYRFHRQTGSQLEMDLGVSKAVMDNEIQYLEYAGLIQSKGVDKSILEIPSHLVYMVGKELRKEGVLNEG